MSGGHQGVDLVGVGYQFSNQEPTAGTSYQEYSIRTINASIAIYTYGCCPSEPWPVANYVITLRRSSHFYIQTIIWPVLAITFLSFGVFFMSYEVGERLGYGITLVLAMEVIKVVITGMVPVSTLHRAAPVDQPAALRLSRYRSAPWLTLP